MAVTRCINCTKDLDTLKQYCDDCRPTNQEALFKATPSATSTSGCPTVDRADDDGASILRLLRSSSTHRIGLRRILESTVDLR